MGYLEKIKYILRGSQYYRKYFQTTVNSLRYYFRNLHYYWQLYSFKKDREVSGNTLYFIIDPNIKHPGLVDRKHSKKYPLPRLGFDCSFALTITITP